MSRSRNGTVDLATVAALKAVRAGGSVGSEAVRMRLIQEGLAEVDSRGGLVLTRKGRSVLDEHEANDPVPDPDADEPATNDEIHSSDPGNAHANPTSASSTTGSGGESPPDQVPPRAQPRKPGW